MGDHEERPGWTDRQRAGQTPTPFELSAGHSRAAHHVLGWCAACSGRTLADEVVEWREWAKHHFNLPIGGW